MKQVIVEMSQSAWASRREPVGVNRSARASRCELIGASQLARASRRRTSGDWVAHVTVTTASFTLTEVRAIAPQLTIGARRDGKRLVNSSFVNSATNLGR